MNCWAKTFVVGSICVLGVSCGYDHPDKTPINIFTITVDPAFLQSARDDWAVAWNSKGELLDYKKYTGGVATTLSTTGDISDNKITVALIDIRPQDGYDSYDVRIYADLTVGQTFSRQTGIGTPQVDDSKKFKVTVPSTGQYRFMGLYDKTGYSPSGVISNADDFVCDCVIPQNGDYNFMYRNDVGVRHKILSNIQANAVVNLAESDFVPYDHEITYTYPPGNVNIMLEGYQADSPLKAPGMILDLYLTGFYTTSVTTGYYGSSFTRFHTYFSLGLGTPNVMVSMEKMGDLFPKINIPDVDGYSINNKDPYNATYAAPSAMLFQQTLWTRQNRDAGGNIKSYVAWTVASPSKQFKIGNLPGEILTPYPDLKVDASNYNSLSFYLGPQTYEQYVGTQLNGNAWDNFEQTQIQIFN